MDGYLLVSNAFQKDLDGSLFHDGISDGHLNDNRQPVGKQTKSMLHPLHEFSIEWAKET